MALRHEKNSCGGKINFRIHIRSKINGMVAQEYLQKQDGSSDLIVNNKNETVKWIVKKKRYLFRQ